MHHDVNTPSRRGGARARELLASLDPGPDDPNAPDAQSAKLIRRVSAFEAGEVKLVNAAEARERVMARLRAFRPK